MYVKVRELVSNGYHISITLNYNLNMISGLFLTLTFAYPISSALSASHHLHILLYMPSLVSYMPSLVDSFIQTMQLS